MRTTTMLTVVVLAAAVVTTASAAGDAYTSKYDSIDVDKILGNDRILDQYVKCLMEEGGCTREGRELKKLLPDALRTDCSKCSEKQKVSTEKVIKHMRSNRKRDWERLVKKYDPSGEFSSKYEAKYSSA